MSVPAAGPQEAAPQTRPYTYGVILPTSDTGEDPGAKPLRLLPDSVRRVSTGLGLRDYTQADVDNAMDRYWTCVDDLVAQGAESIVLAGVPVSSQLGRDRVLELLAETTRRAGVPADTALEAIIAACGHLGVRSLAIGSRWAQQLNDAMTAYLKQAGIDVVYINSVGQWGRQAFSMSFEEGVRLALELGTDALRKAPQAHALLLPGGTWRPFGVLSFLEETSGKPVITNESARLWRVIHGGYAPPVTGWGRLLAQG